MTKIYSLMSLTPQNGAKYVATNLANQLIKNNKNKVLLIDFDFLNPVLCYHFVKDSIYSLDNLEPYGSHLKENDFLNNITSTPLNFDVLKGSKLGKPELFSKELIIKIINYAKSNYDYIFIVLNPDVSIDTTIVSLLNSDEIIMIVRNNYCDNIKITQTASIVNKFNRNKTIKIIENFTNYNNNINVIDKIKDLNVGYLGALEFDPKSIDNLNLNKKSLFKPKNINDPKFKNILKILKGEGYSNERKSKVKRKKAR